MWVPVGIKNNYSVGRLQVEAQASSPCAQEENEVLRLWVIEGLQQHPSILSLGRT